MFYLLPTESLELCFGLQVIWWHILGAKDTDAAITNILLTALQLLRTLTL